MRTLGVLVALITLAAAGSAGAGISIPPPPGDTQPAWSPDGSVIVFLSERDGLSLRVLNADGSDEHRLPWLPANATYAFSPDWSHVAAFESGQVVVERLDGSDRLSLGPAAYVTKPSWSPDGTRVVFLAPSAVPNAADVVVARIDGSETRRIAQGRDPVWSPVADRIAYVSGDYEETQLHVIQADGNGDTAITPNTTPWTRPVWSPDGTRIAASHSTPDGRSRTVEILRADGTRLESIPVYVFSDMAWSPRGDAIALTASDGVVTIDLGSHRRRRLTSFFAGEVAWSPDGGQLAVSAGGECRNRNGIYRVALDRPRPLRLTNDCRILGTAGDDVLSGTPLADVLLGEGGNDTLKAVWGDWTGDTLEGGPGKDLLLGSFRSDTLDGGPGADILRGGPTADRLVGGPGRDVLQGQGGRDAIFARDGWRDRVSCGTNVGRTTGPEGDVAYVDRFDRVARDCEYVYRPGPAPPLRGRTSLLIRIWPDGNRGAASPRLQYTLRCRRAGGTLPHARTGCVRLARIQNPFAPVSPAEDCALIYAGDETAAVRGVYGGRPVRTSFDRQGSCSVRRWNRVAFLFP